MKKLDPSYVWQFFIQSVLGIVVTLGFIGLIFFCPFIFGATSEEQGFFGFLFFFFAIGFLIVAVLTAVISFVWAKLTYNNYFYELKEDGFYKESGVITKKYVTIPYEKIQNVDIHRSLIARMFGLSDLQIQTAGMSASFGRYGAYGVGAEGRLPGVSEADAKTIRDELIKRAKGAKSQGGL